MLPRARHWVSSQEEKGRKGKEREGHMWREEGEREKENENEVRRERDGKEKRRAGRREEEREGDFFSSVLGV